MIPVLPETDLARVAIMAPEQRWKALWAMRSGRSPYSYKHTKKLLPDIANVQPPLPIACRATSWSEIVAELERRTTSAVEFQANEDVADLIFQFARREGVKARYQDFGRFPLGLGVSIAYWENFYFVLGSEVIVPCIDLRKGGYGPLARKFAFSVANEQIRVLGGDFADVRFVMLQCPADKNGVRFLRTSTSDGLGLFSYEEIVRMSVETYQTWLAVCRAKAEAERREREGKTGTGG